MNNIIRDSLENHRKNLYNFYLACNILGNNNTNKPNFSSTTQEDVDIKESRVSSFVPFFTFADVKASEIVKEICQDTNQIVDYDNAIGTADKSNSVVVICNKQCQFEGDAKCKEEREVKEIVESPVDSGHEEIYFRNKSPVLDEENSFCGSSEELTSKIQIFDEKRLFKNETYFGRNENEDCGSSGNMIPLKDEFSCNNCMKLFHHQSSFSRHVAKCLDRVRVKEEKKRINETRVKKWTKSSKIDKTCKICGHVARKPCELKMHLSKHTGEKQFLCKECGLGFSSTSKLNRHIRSKVHSKSKFYCELCKTYFTLKASYVRHKSEHALPVVKMKPFACVKCGKRFSRLDTLKKHTDVHSQEDREFFECMACERKFSRKDTLSHHIIRKKCPKIRQDDIMND